MKKGPLILNDKFCRGLSMSDPDDQQLPLPIRHNNYPSVPSDYHLDAIGYIQKGPLPTGNRPVTDIPHNMFNTEYKAVYTEECIHISINVGFNRAKFVCKKCDKVLEE